MAPTWTWDKSLICNMCNSHFQKYCKLRPANVPRKGNMKNIEWYLFEKSIKFIYFVDGAKMDMG